MDTRFTHTAVLLFSLPDHHDAARKRLADGRPQKRAHARNRAFWGSMQQFTVAKVNAAGLSCIRSTKILSSSDYAAPFGRQLQTAVSGVLAQGYSNVIVIGNDCPDLRVGDLLKAADDLALGRLPIGYNQRGGVYLMGFDQRFLWKDYANTFAELPWQTAGLGRCLADFLASAFGHVSVLSAVRADWNTRFDLRGGAWLLGAFTDLAHRLWAMVAPEPYPIDATLAYRFSTQTRHYGLRAPPVSA